MYWSTEISTYRASTTSELKYYILGNLVHKSTQILEMSTQNLAQGVKKPKVDIKLFKNRMSDT